MDTDVQGLMLWISICLAFAAICTTMFPILYMFAPWYKSALGRAIMVQSIGFALAIDFTLFFMFWTPGIRVRFAIAAIVFTLVAFSAGYLTWLQWKFNYRNYQRKTGQNGRQHPLRRSTDFADPQ